MITATAALLSFVLVVNTPPPQRSNSFSPEHRRDWEIPRQQALAALARVTRPRDNRVQIRAEDEIQQCVPCEPRQARAEAVAAHRHSSSTEGGPAAGRTVLAQDINGQCERRGGAHARAHLGASRDTQARHAVIGECEGQERDDAHGYGGARTRKARAHGVAERSRRQPEQRK